MDHIIVDYVWIGGKGELRSKTRVIHDSSLFSRIITLQDIPDWNYDGSSTGQAEGNASEIFIKPRRLFKCPFRIGGPRSYIVMCDTYTPDNKPALYNNRNSAKEIFDKYSDQKSWFGLEQEYFIYDVETNKPIGFDNIITKNQFYCGVGRRNIFGRELSDSHMIHCLMAGIKISGTNAEVSPGQWEYQIGPVEGIDAADQLWISRYILEKLSEQYGVYVSFHPKPIMGDWNGSGCHTNFSTEAMRSEGGYDLIISCMDKLANKHKEHMEIYGDDNDIRMSGFHETSAYDTFTYGIGTRGSSVRIPNETISNGKGYFEDRRPASNMDPYLVTSKLLETIME